MCRGSVPGGRSPSSTACRNRLLKGRGVRVNAISPGPVDTPGLTSLFGEWNAPTVPAKLIPDTAIGRMGRPEEIAAVVAFLASDQSSYVLGANWYVDGGENQI